MTSNLPMDDLPGIRPGKGLTLLAGVRVVDLTTSIAGPYATMLLADMGAEIIKIERPGGDDARGWGPPFLNGESLWFTSVNRGKKSVVLDLTTDADMTTLRQLVATADVFITNQPPRVQKKLGLDYDSVKTWHDEIVFTSITGFGLTGARADLTCYDLIAEGYSGIMDVTGTADSPPQKVGSPAADMLSGQDAAMATIAALFERKTSGKGHLVDVALVDSMTRFLTPRLSSYLGSGEIPTRSGGTDSVIAIYQAFDTADAPITLGLGTNGIWERFCDVAGLHEFMDRDGYRSNADRHAKRAEIVAAIQGELLKRTRAEWLEVFRSARVPAGPINRIDEVATDQNLAERGLFYRLTDEDREVPQIGLGIRIDDQQAIPQSLPPLCGQHNDEVLASLTPDKPTNQNTSESGRK